MHSFIALNSLVKAPDLKMLEIVKNEFSGHSKNEEDLLLSLGFGGSSRGSLSALKSHTDDHSRIVAMMDQVLQNGVLSSTDVKKVAEAIYQHADRFDVLYAADNNESKVINTKLGS